MAWDGYGILPYLNGNSLIAMRRTLSLIPLLAILFLGVVLHDVAAAQPTADNCTVLVVPEGVKPLQSAIDAAPNGSVVCVREGVYREVVRIPSTKTNLTIMAYPGEKPVIDGNYRLPGTEFDTLVRVTGQNIILDGLEIRHSTGRGLVVSVPSTDITIRNLSIHDNWNTGFLATGDMPVTRSGSVTYVSDVVVENTDVFHNIRKAANAPYLLLATRPADSTDPAAWTFDVDAVWDAPYWSGRQTDLPTPYPEDISLQYDQTGTLNRVFVTVGNTQTRYIGADFSSSGTQIAFDNREVLFYDLPLGKWTPYFDGTAFGIAPVAGSDPGINAFELISPTVGLSETIACPACYPILMSFSASASVPGIGTVGPGDIVQFTPTDVVTGTGQVAAGAFSLYRTAAELGIGTASIDALAVMPDGRLVLSTVAALSVNGRTVPADDLIAGDRGVWTNFFDASDAPGNPFRTLVTSAALDPAGNLVISGDPTGGSGLVFMAAQDSVARNSRVYRNFGEGLVIGRWSDRVTLEDNTVWDNDHASLYLNGATFPTVQRNLVYCSDDRNYWDKSNNPLFRAPPGFILRDEDFKGMNPPTSRGQIILNNTVVGCGTNFMIDAQPEDGSTAPRGGLRDAIVAHNTFVQARGEAGATQGVNNVQFTNKARYENSTFASNILLQNAVSGNLPSVASGSTSALTIIPPFAVTGNLYSRSPFSTWFGSGTAYPETSRLVGDPKLANFILPVKDQVVDAAWYLPGVGSPAIDSAVQISGLVYSGLSQTPANPPDRGVDAQVSAADRPGQIVIQVVNDPIEDTPFSFSSSKLGSFTLKGLSNPSQQFLGLAPGVYDVTQALPTGWGLIGLSCNTTDRDDTTTKSGLTVRIDLDPGEVVECFYNNYQRRGTITVKAATDPAGASASFTFDPSWSTTNFTLTDGGSLDSPPLLVGKHTVMPVNLPRGWSVTGASCSDSSDPTGPDGIVLDPGEDVTCTYYFRLARGRIVLQQETVPAGAGQTFTYSPSWDTVPIVLGNGQSVESAALLPGDYVVTVTDPPANWSLAAATCDDDNSASPSSIVLDPGETVTCTLRHTYDLASRIVVAKQTDPDGDSTAFDFASSWSPAFSLSDGQSIRSDWLMPGTYTMTEVNIPHGWSVSAVDCGGLDPNSLELGPAVTVTCTFTNTLARGSITVVKQTDPLDDPMLFEFDPTWSAQNFTLSGGGSHASGPLLPGTYAVSEVNPPADWTQTGAVCDDGSDPSSIAVGPGEQVTCTFSSTEARGSITVVKQTDFPGDTTAFDFDPSWSDTNFSLTAGGSYSSGPLVHGTYAVSEINLPAGWSLSSATCSDGSDPSSIDLAPSEDVTCTFANTVARGTITVVKQTNPDGDVTAFSFDPSWSVDNFSLTDNGSKGSGPLLPGTYSVAEVSIPTNWTLTSATCSDGSDPASISLSAGENVTCTFNNTLRGRVITRKVTLPAGSTTQFEFDPSWSATNFKLTDGTQAGSGRILPGTYSVAELNIPASWELTSATCTDGSPITAIQLSAGETVTCTFTNTQRGSITVVKQTDPDGDTTQFEFDPSWSATNFLLTDNGSAGSGLLAAGTYSVAEVGIPAGWSLSGASCSDGSPVTAIQLSPGEAVTCTFNNTLSRGSITVVKQTDPDGDTTQFEFDPSWSMANFMLADNGSTTSAALLPGTYSVSEVNLPAGWSQTGATCSDGSDPSSISLSAGETVTCTFNNLLSRGGITIVKQTDPRGDTTAFEFDPSWSTTNFTLTDGAQKSATTLAPGTYSVAELPSAGWTLISATCSDGSPISAIQLSGGESITCTFTNQKQQAQVTERIFASPNTTSSVDGGPTFTANDILVQDRPGNVWSMKLQGSTVGITRNINGLAILPDGSYLLTLARSQAVGSLGTVTTQDVIRYVWPSGGTPGRFEWYLRGAKVGLGTGESIDALALTPDGRLLVSTVGSLSVPCTVNATTCPSGTLKGADEDLIAYTGTTGASSAGKWELWFDGSKITGMSVEDVVGASVDASTGVIYISLMDAFTVGGQRGNAKTILSVAPSGSSYRVALFPNWPDARFKSTVDAFEILPP